MFQATHHASILHNVTYDVHASKVKTSPQERIIAAKIVIFPSEDKAAHSTLQGRLFLFCEGQNTACFCGKALGFAPTVLEVLLQLLPTATKQKRCYMGLQSNFCQ